MRIPAKTRICLGLCLLPLDLLRCLVTLVAPGTFVVAGEPVGVQRAHWWVTFSLNGEGVTQEFFDKWDYFNEWCNRVIE